LIAGDMKMLAIKEKKKRNRRNRWKCWKTVLDTLVSLSTIVSLFIVYGTLREMQIQRDRAYSPLIIIEDTKVHINWDGIASDDGVSASVGINPLVKDGDVVNPVMVSVNARNIGVGAAKKIHVTINSEKLIYDMIETLNKNLKYESKKYELNKDGDILYLFNGTNSLGANEIIYSDKPFLLPNAEENFTIGIPPLLNSIVKEFYVKGLQELIKNFPITLNVAYQDIQGKKYSSEIKLYYEP
jgi:hypothetical protein